MPQLKAPAAAKESVAAIVVTYRTGPILAQCLQALVRAEASEILIVDNGNSGEQRDTMDVFAARDARARVARGQGNIGFAAACNLAARQARSDVLVFVNPDVVLTPGALARLRDELADVSRPAILGGDLRDPSGASDRGARRERLTLWRAFVSFTGLSRLEAISPAFRDFNRHTDPMPAQAVEVAVVSGALLAVRRQDFEALGGFDEGYFLHVEDVDLCRRAQDAGWRVLFQPGPHGVHTRSSSGERPRVVALHKARGFRRYFRKFARGSLERIIAEIVGAALIALASLRR